MRRFGQRAASDAARRKAGKLYADCKTHGRFGFDGAPGMQDYILDNGEIWGSENGYAAVGERQAGAVPVTPASAPAKSAPASAPAAKPEQKKPRGIFEW